MNARPPRHAMAASVAFALALSLAACGEAAEPQATSPAPPASQAAEGGASLRLPAAGTPAPAGAPSQVDPALIERFEALRAAIQTDPTDAEPRRELAYLLDANGILELAREAYDNWRAADPEDPRASYHQARMRAETGELEEAVEALDKSIALRDDYVPAHWRRGLLLLEMDRGEEARASFRRATELDPGDVSGWVGLARVALQAGRPAEACELLEPLLADHPDDGYVHQLLGRAWSERGDEARAREHASHDPGRSSAWSVDPWRAEIAGYLVGLPGTLAAARAALASDDPARSVALLEPYAVAQPDHASLQGTLVKAYLQLDRVEDASALLERAEEKGGQHYRTEINRAVVALALGEVEQAVASLESAVRLNPAYAPAHLFLGQLQLELGNAEGARSSLGEAMRLGEEGPDAFLMLGMAEHGLGRLDEALATFERVAQRYPELAEPWLGVAAVELDRGHASAVEAALERARERNPEHPDLVTLGARLAELGG